MRRWLLPVALAFLVVGVALTLAGNYGRQLVHDQLAAQKIKFAPYDPSGQNGDNYQAYLELRDRAGTTVTDGLAARDFATYINAHVMQATGGRSYSEVSAEARAVPENQELAEVRRTALDGQLLAAIMWNTYGWWLLATVSFFAGIALIVVSRRSRPGPRAGPRFERNGRGLPRRSCTCPEPNMWLSTPREPPDLP
jgi:hypothetical protein